MPPTETPPNPAPVVPPPPPAPVKVVTRRFGELDHTELVQLLDSLEGDQAKARFRESIYISVIVYLILAWLAVYGPRYIFKTGHVVPSAAETKEREKLSQLDLTKDLAKLQHVPPKVLPHVDQKLQKQLQQMQRQNEIAKAAPPPPPPAPAPAPAPVPLPAAAPPPPTPLPATPQPQLPKAPTPQPSSIPDAPRPNFQTPTTAGNAVSEAANNAARSHSGGGRITDGPASRGGYGGAGTGVEILSDTQGVDFTDYIKKLLRILKAAWLPLIPEECYPPLNKEGWTLIKFRIMPNGALAQPMTLDASTHDRAIDKAAWGSIVSVAQFPPLPAAYKGPNLDLRIQFIISKDAPDTQ